MIDQQKYAELQEQYMELGATIDEIDKERSQLYSQMVTAAKDFPDIFYFRVGDKLLYRDHKTNSIVLRTFDQ